MQGLAQSPRPKGWMDLDPKDGWTQAQEAQNNKFVENRLKKWALVNQLINKWILMVRERK